MKRAAATDPERFARIAARYPTVPLRSFRRPRRITVDGQQREISDVPFAEGEFTGTGDPTSEQVHRDWLSEGAWS